MEECHLEMRIIRRLSSTSAKEGDLRPFAELYNDCGT